MLGRISLGTIATLAGAALTLVGFYAYFVLDNATLNLAGFFYGIPVLLGGLALKSAELRPVPYTQPTDAETARLRQSQATPVQNQVRNDITRFRYGQEAHLDVALEKLGLSPTDEERPELVALREEAREGAYTLVLEFQSPLIGFDVWQEKQDRIGRFFGPGIRAEVSQPADQRVEVALIAQPAA